MAEGMVNIVILQMCYLPFLCLSPSLSVCVCVYWMSLPMLQCCMSWVLVSGPHCTDTLQLVTAGRNLTQTSQAELGSQDTRGHGVLATDSGRRDAGKWRDCTVHSSALGIGHHIGVDLYILRKVKLFYSVFEIYPSPEP